MKTIDIVATVLENEKDAKAYLRAVGVRGPSLHPDVNSPDPWKHWNGWNHTLVVGVDPEGKAVEIQSWHFAAGGVDFSVSLNGGQSRLSTGSFNGVQWPVHAFPAIPVILHPEHTPTEEN